MRRAFLVLLLSFTFTLVSALPTGAISRISALTWSKTLVVHRCEADPWHDKGPKYMGGLGWRPATWTTFGYPITHLRYAYQATIRQQIEAMQLFVDKYGWPNDFNGGCHGY